MDREMGLCTCIAWDQRRQCLREWGYNGRRLAWEDTWGAHWPLVREAVCFLQCGRGKSGYNHHDGVDLSIIHLSCGMIECDVFGIPVPVSSAANSGPQDHHSVTLRQPVIYQITASSHSIITPRRKPVDTPSPTMEALPSCITPSVSFQTPTPTPFKIKNQK